MTFFASPVVKFASAASAMRTASSRVTPGPCSAVCSLHPAMASTATLNIQMRAGQQIGYFGEQVDAALEDLKQRLPEDLILARTSDQPLQVEENVHLFM